MTNRAQLISALERFATKKNTVTESTVLSALMKNITWVKGDKGERGPVGPIGPVGPRGPQGEKGDRGNDAPQIPVRLLVEEMAKDGRFKGEHGENGNANMEEVMECAEECAEHEVEEHEKEHDHKLLHDSRVLGEYELDQTTLKDGDILQVKGKKLVGIKMQMPDIQGLRTWVSSQGVSNFRSYPITSSQTIEQMAIYVVDATAGNITITVPSAAGRENFWFEIIRIDGSSNTVTVVPTGSETLSGETSYLMQQWTDLRIFAHNGSYLIRSAG